MPEMPHPRPAPGDMARVTRVILLNMLEAAETDEEREALVDVMIEELHRLGYTVSLGYAESEADPARGALLPPVEQSPRVLGDLRGE